MPAAAKADTILLSALDELRALEHPADGEELFALAAPHASRRADRQLLRVIEMLSGASLTSAVAKWREFCAVREATQSLEDELVVANRDLRRSNSMLATLLQHQPRR